MDDLVDEKNSDMEETAELGVAAKLQVEQPGWYYIRVKSLTRNGVYGLKIER